MTQPENVKKKRSPWIHVLWIGLTVIILLLALITVPAFMLFEKEPVTLDHAGTSPFLAFSVMQKGQKNLDEMRRSNPMTLSRVKYTEDEFNFMVRTMIMSNLLQQHGEKGISSKRTSLIVKNGIFRIKHIIEMPGNPFGNYLNLSLDLKLTVENGKETIEVLSAKAGSLNIPKGRAEKKISDMLDQYYHGTAQEDMIRNSVTLFRADGENILLEYKPYSLLRDIDNIYFGGSGEFLRKMGHDETAK